MVMKHDLLGVGDQSMPHGEGKKMIRGHCGPFEGSENKEKSILDNVKVKDSAFPLGETKEMPKRNCNDSLGIVSNCSKCGAPIYGEAYSQRESPLVRFSCECRNK